MLIREVIAVGECYRWAGKYITSTGRGVLVHATVHDLWDGHAYQHAWIEDNGKCLDWQTMEVGSSKYGKKGWPKEEFYGAYKPINIKRYDENKATTMLVKNKHWGPWE